MSFNHIQGKVNRAGFKCSIHKPKISVPTADGQVIIKNFQSDLQKTVGAKSIKIGENNGKEVKIDELVFKINF